ncbi:hypothetical protein [Marinilabilia rubra]|uniref:Uncharacterized protein n=1 Tax=Marinilabilia rubra TaxID=2162893 RepID=A0A2U2B3G9_9BACT|nr:hypothetical protein [Marinilabilia rubra]PWD97613.1 hypothetical protein DDZ16_19935 [Marinilabilia rubra]
MKHLLFLLSISVISTVIISCEEVEYTEIPEEETVTETKRIGFELVQIISMDSILVWANNEILTQEEFDSIQITSGWQKNEPREGMPDYAKFLRSPDAGEDREFTSAEHFGFQWLFNAQIVDSNAELPENEDGLLSGRYIAKYHQVTFNEGRTLSILISPQGEEYVLISRDANRITDIPVIPETWQIEEREINDSITFDLPNPTLNIRAENNQDSWQGPVIL